MKERVGGQSLHPSFSLISVENSCANESFAPLLDPPPPARYGKPAVDSVNGS